jgi:Protein of unknown function (DUF1573)
MNFRVSTLLFLLAFPIVLFAQTTTPNIAKPVKKHTKKHHRAAAAPTATMDTSTSITAPEVAMESTTPRSTVAIRKQPGISFTETVHNFGEIKQGDTVKYDFEFTNTGTEELLILEAEASCGCTHPSYPFIPIAPGEKGKIGVLFNSAGKMGIQRPYVTVTTNAQPKIWKVNLEGVVR